MKQEIAELKRQADGLQSAITGFIAAAERLQLAMERRSPTEARAHQSGLSSLTPDRLFTTAEAAEVLGVAAGTLRVWRTTKRGGPPHVKIGRAVRYRGRDLLEYINAQSVR